MYNAMFNRYDGDDEYEPPEELWAHCNACGGDFCWAEAPHTCSCIYCGSDNTSPLAPTGRATYQHPAGEHAVPAAPGSEPGRGTRDGQ